MVATSVLLGVECFFLQSQKLKAGVLSQIFIFFLYLSWSRAGIYPDAHPAPIIPPDAPLHPDGGDVPSSLMRLMR
jgi:hypothetical protein